jgi:hypothetical protein
VENEIGGKDSIDGLLLKQDRRYGKIVISIRLFLMANSVFEMNNSIKT